MTALAPGDTIRCRPMTLRDVERVHEIDVLSFSLPWSERSYRFELTENKTTAAWVVEVLRADGTAVLAGILIIWVILDEAHVATIATHPGYRGLGMGKKLLARGLLAAYERGARSAYLEVRRSNTVAQHLYLQFGFAVVGERLRYYKDNNEDALLMTLAQIEPRVLQQAAAEEV